MTGPQRTFLYVSCSAGDSISRTSKSVVARDVVRRVTRGTLTEDSLLDARRHNYLAALSEAAGLFGLAWVDISTGGFFVETLEEVGLAAALARLEANELLLPERLKPTRYSSSCCS